MGFNLSHAQFDAVLTQLAQKYILYAPKKFAGKGRYSDTDLVRYDLIKQTQDIEFKRKSDMPAKEVVTPITETIMFFVDGEIRPSKISEKETLLFVRACDLHAFKRMDDIYLGNGGFNDLYYQRRRNKVKFAVIECPQNGWDTCFCVATETNHADDYALALQFSDDEVKLELKDPELNAYLANNLPETSSDYKFQAVQANQLQVTIPQISDKETLLKIKNHKMWDEYNRRCVMCGSCTVACPTCSCFTTYDVNYSSDSNAGERRRIASSCHVDGFTDMAGGHAFRNSAAERMRYKALHKIHDHKQRFGQNMCVGCGRCDDRCPEHISFSTMVNKISLELAAMQEERGNE